MLPRHSDPRPQTPSTRRPARVSRPRAGNFPGSAALARAPAALMALLVGVLLGSSGGGEAMQFPPLHHSAYVRSIATSPARATRAAPRAPRGTPGGDAEAASPRRASLGARLCRACSGCATPPADHAKQTIPRNGVAPAATQLTGAGSDAVVRVDAIGGVTTRAETEPSTEAALREPTSSVARHLSVLAPMRHKLSVARAFL